MKKSSLGRRSSIMSQGRVSTVDKNSNRLSSADGKKSFIPKPTYSSKTDRASSVERESVMSATKKNLFGSTGTLRRSKSSLDMGRSSTPCQTPLQFNRRVTGGSCRTTEGRPSSVGGPKSARKESRPVNEKSFQSQAQQKVQQFFLNHAPNLLDKGSIKPMTAGMFADLVGFLISSFDKRMIITRVNFIEEIPNLCRLYNYKGKTEKSWLMTVNAPHSWPYVVSFLLWLVELYEVSEAFNVYEAMYPEKVDGEPEINDVDFKLLVPHLLKGYNLSDDKDEIRQFLVEYKSALNVNEITIDELQKEYNELQKELNDSEDVMEEEKFEEQKRIYEAVKMDIKKTQEYIYETENYVATQNDKRQDKAQRFQECEKYIEKLRLEKEELEKLVDSQEISQDCKKSMEATAAMLQREIIQMQEQITDYQNEVFKEDIQLVNIKKQSDKSIRAFNKEITVNLVTLPALKGLQIEEDNKILHMNVASDKSFLHEIDEKEKELKVELKNNNRNLTVKIDNLKLSIQKIEDEYSTQIENWERLKNDCDQLEIDINTIKTEINKDKEQVPAELTEIHQKIKAEKEKLVLEKSTLQLELDDVEKRYNKKKTEYDNYAKEAFAVLEDRKQSINGYRKRLEEMTTGVMEDLRQTLMTKFKEDIENIRI